MEYKSLMNHALLTIAVTLLNKYDYYYTGKGYKFTPVVWLFVLTELIL